MSMTVPKSTSVKGRKLKKVTTAYHVQGGAAREPASVTIWKSGRSITNVEGGELLIALVTAAGQDPKRFLLSPGVDSENSVVGVAVVPSGVAGAITARPVGDERNIVLHLGGVFKEYPQLRPVGKRQYMVAVEPDEDGVMCLMIDLKSGIMKRAGTRGDGSNGESGQDAAAGQQK
jgi:hypothetical protein